MKEKKHGLLHFIIAAVAIANLVVLFLFQYGLSETTPAVQAAQRASEERAAKSGNSSSGAEAASENAAAPESSEGAGEVSATGAETGTGDSAEEANAASASSENGDAAGQNETEETNGASPQNNAESAGSGSEGSDAASGSGRPSITISEPLPTVDTGDLPNLAKVFSDLGYISADDGYGNDITDQITADYEEISSDSLEYRVTFSVISFAGISASETVTVTTQSGTKPLLELTSDTIRLSVGESFYYMSYIKTARDVDGTSLDTRISISGVVDTSTRGTYELEYSTVSRITSERVSRVLTIIVE